VVLADPESEQSESVAGDGEQSVQGASLASASVRKERCTVGEEGANGFEKSGRRRKRGKGGAAERGKRASERVSGAGEGPCAESGGVRAPGACGEESEEVRGGRMRRRGGWWCELATRGGER